MHFLTYQLGQLIVIEQIDELLYSFKRLLVLAWVSLHLVQLSDPIGQSSLHFVHFY